MTLVSSNKSGSNKKQQNNKEKAQHTLFGLVFSIAAQAQPQNLKTTVEIQSSDWSKFLVPRGTMGKFFIFFKSAVENEWEATAS